MSERGECLTNGEILRALGNGQRGVHFIGVGGVSMRSLFCLCRHFGISASGSDRKEDRLLRSLIECGEDLVIGERDTLPIDTALIVYSHAIPENHPERRLGRERGVPEVSRDRFLGALMECYDRRIGVSGSHGKSTVTAMIAKIFCDAAKKPTVLSGASLFKSRLPFLIGSLDYLIYEGCEYKDSFLSFSPSLAVFLGIELDHTDYFESIERLSESFLSAMKRAKKALVNADDPRLLSLALRSGSEIVTFGKVAFADYRYERKMSKVGEISLDIFKKERKVGNITFPMRGEFNALNAVAAVAAAMEEGIDFSLVASSLSGFCGIDRRLEVVGEFQGRRVLYDYAHHPTEIRESVRAVREDGARKVTVIFRPHTYSRTSGLWEGFVRALSLSDYTLLLDIDGVREENIYGVSSERLAECVGGVYCRNADELITALKSSEGDIIIMGAADMEWVKELITN